MKTPQEIAAECWIGHDHDEFVQEYPKIGLACGMCLDNTVAALAAAREEGRREGIEQAVLTLRVFCEDNHEYPCKDDDRLGRTIRALASQPKPEPVVTCEGCKRTLPFATDATLIHGRLPHVEFVKHIGGNVYTPCTAKPGGGKEP